MYNAATSQMVDTKGNFAVLLDIVAQVLYNT